MRPLVALIVAVTLLLGSGHAAELSPEIKAKAKAHFENGEKAFKLGEFPRAIQEFKAAFELSSEPLLLYNLGQALRLSGDNKQALFFYRQFVVNGAPGPQRKVAQQKIVELEKVLEAQKTTQESPPTGTASGKPGAETEKTTPPAPPPRAVEPASSQTAGPAVVQLRPRPWYRSPAGWTLSSLGLAVAIGGAGLMGAGAARDTDADTAPTLDDHLRAANDASNFQVGGAAMLGIGGAAIVAGIVVFAIEARRRPTVGTRDAQIAMDLSRTVGR